MGKARNAAISMCIIFLRICKEKESWLHATIISAYLLACRVLEEGKVHFPRLHKAYL